MLAFAAGTALSACAQPNPSATISAPYDPYEAENRRMHAFNVSLDRAIVRPVAKGYSDFVADDVEQVIGNFATNMSMPSSIVNNILQGNGRDASQDFYRMVINTTIGLGGLIDVATDMKMPPRSDADFGETLYVWGVAEGPYLELPLIGPASTRDAAGRTVDLFTNPLDYVLESPESYYGTGASGLKTLGARGRFGDSIDSLLYDSADSYAASRSLYLQNRRYKLGKSGTDDYLDPYDATYGGAAVSSDFEDPYDQ
ncbi:VacJ family lipoprotein [Rhodobacteraceae bacterium KMM 6894]|nr:VacJ family lipoprotein [Rhodobacteraceae bacterium KMM 6894]